MRVTRESTTSGANGPSERESNHVSATVRRLHCPPWAVKTADVLACTDALSAAAANDDADDERGTGKEGLADVRIHSH